MNVDRYISSMTSDPRMQKIVKLLATVDDTPDSRRVFRAWLSTEITELVRERSPRIMRSCQEFVRAPEPKNIYRGLMLYVWLCEEIPPNQDRGALVFLAMQDYLEKEAKADAAREMVNLLGANAY